MKPSYAETSKPVGVDRKIFISCASDGLSVAREIEEELTKNGFTVFSGQGLQGGDFRADRLRTMIAKSDFFIALVTSEFLHDYFVFSELAQIIDEQRRVLRKRVMPIILDKNVRAPAMLAMYHPLDLSDPSSRKCGIRLLVETININVSQNASPSQDLLEWDDLVATQSRNIEVSHQALIHEMAAYSSAQDSQTVHTRRQFQKGILVSISFALGSIITVSLFSNSDSSWFIEILLGALVVSNILLGLAVLIKQTAR